MVVTFPVVGPSFPVFFHKSCLKSLFGNDPNPDCSNACTLLTSLGMSHQLTKVAEEMLTTANKLLSEVCEIPISLRQFIKPRIV